MSNHHVLRLMHCRPGQLFARACPAVWLPLPLAGGLTLLLLGSALLAREVPLLLVLLVFFWSLACFAIAASLPLRAGALTVDLSRGWVHWQSREGLHTRHESFAPCRLERVVMQRRGLRIYGMGWWEVQLRLDHPRLAVVCLWSGLRGAVAELRARELAEALGLPWTDAAGLLRVSLHGAQNSATTPATAVPLRAELSTAALPPPEILCAGRTAAQAHYLLPRQPLQETASANYLAYALVWAAWSWSALIYQGLKLGDWDGWSPTQHGGVALLFGSALTGCVLLGHALMRTLGREELRRTSEGWRVMQRWLGVPCARASFKPTPHAYIRRVDGPAEEAGLWLPTPQGEVRVGAQLSAEALGWLCRTLQRDIERSAQSADAAVSGAAGVPTGEAA